MHDISIHDNVLNQDRIQTYGPAPLNHTTTTAAPQQPPSGASRLRASSAAPDAQRARVANVSARTGCRVNATGA